MFTTALRQHARIAATRNIFSISRLNGHSLLLNGRALSVSASVRDDWGQRRPSRQDNYSSFDQQPQTFQRRSERPPRQPNPPSSTVFVGNLPYSASESDVQSVFEKFGEIVNVRMAYDPEGRFKGYAHVDFENQSDAVTVVEQGRSEEGGADLEVGGRQVRLDFAPPKREGAGPNGLESRPNRRLYVHNFRGDVDELMEVFEEYGIGDEAISSLAGDRTTRFWIDFGTAERATEALERFKGTRTESGSVLTLAYARPRPEREGRGGGGGRGQGGSYGGSGGERRGGGGKASYGLRR